jgi:predicted nucleic acid-binding Zn ribbon protein
MSLRRGPRSLATALGEARRRAQPITLLAAVQGAWVAVAGARVAEEAEPVAERDGVVTIACRSATWAQELDLLSPELVRRLNAALSASGQESPYGAVTALRFTADRPPAPPDT